MKLINILSKKEYEVVRLIAGEGLSYKEAAAVRKVSYHTVANQMKKVREKLHVQKVTEISIRLHHQEAPVIQMFSSITKKIA